jgi:hypothetical protein
VPFWKCPRTVLRAGAGAFFEPSAGSTGCFSFWGGSTRGIVASTGMRSRRKLSSPLNSFSKASMTASVFSAETRILIRSPREQGASSQEISSSRSPRISLTRVPDCRGMMSSIRRRSIRLSRSRIRLFVHYRAARPPGQVGLTRSSGDCILFFLSGKFPAEKPRDGGLRRGGPFKIKESS